MRVSARAAGYRLKVADEVWIATALLHREHPDRTEFTVSEIVERVRREGISDRLRPGVYVHVIQHCVANRSPKPARYRMLFESRATRRRLYRPGDPCDPARDGAKWVPARQDIPERYRPLLEWYESEYAVRRPRESKIDPLVALRGSGKALWASEHADRYVRRLREGWE